MTENINRCLTTLKNGEPCPYKGRPEYKGYCGVHRASSLLEAAESAKERDERLVSLLSGGAALIEITSKAVEHLPSLIEVLNKGIWDRIYRGSSDIK